MRIVRRETLTSYDKSPRQIVLSSDEIPLATIYESDVGGTVQARRLAEMILKGLEATYAK